DGTRDPDKHVEHIDTILDYHGTCGDPDKHVETLNLNELESRVKKERLNLESEFDEDKSKFERS
ncbi:hypothetical protein A2U01_0045967, partial [Trifolium medium]|nr:hypothetical protein [Trifolium medium]